MMKTRESIHSNNKNKVTLEGAALELFGLTLRCGHTFPQTVVKNFSLNNVDPVVEGKTLILTIPSVDTPICDMQIKQLNESVPLIDNIIIISADTVFAQKRFCNENNINDSIVFYSDAENHNFGETTGLQILGLGLLTRSLIICDKNKIIRHLQVVPELTMLPDIDFALSSI